MADCCKEIFWRRAPVHKLEVLKNTYGTLGWKVVRVEKQDYLPEGWLAVEFVGTCSCCKEECPCNDPFGGCHCKFPQVPDPEPSFDEELQRDAAEAHKRGELKCAGKEGNPKDCCFCRAEKGQT